MSKEISSAATSGLVAVLAVGVIVSAMPEYYSGIATKTLIFIGLAMAWNIVGGIGGQLSLGHSVFIGLGALLPAAIMLASCSDSGDKSAKDAAPKTEPAAPADL